MKKFICLALILFGVWSAFAQTERTITEDEFVKVVKNSEKRYLNFIVSPNRHQCVYELAFDFNGDAKPIQSGKFVVETDVNRNIYRVAEFSGQSSVSGKYVSYKSEKILILGTRFERNDDGEWSQVSKDTKPEKAGTCLSFSSREYVTGSAESQDILLKPIEYKYLGSERINNEPTDIYARFESYKNVGKSGKILTKVFASKGWFDKNGLILKSEVEIQFDNDGNKSITRGIQTWEKLDSRFVIKAPVSTNAK